MTSGPKRSLRPLRAALDVLTCRNDFAHHRALAGLGYIMAYKASIEIKTGIGLCSIVMVTSGGFGLQRWRAKRLAAGMKHPTEDPDDETPAHS